MPAPYTSPQPSRSDPRTPSEHPLSSAAYLCEYVAAGVTQPRLILTGQAGTVSRINVSDQHRPRCPAPPRSGRQRRQMRRRRLPARAPWYRARRRPARSATAVPDMLAVLSSVGQVPLACGDVCQLTASRRMSLPYNSGTQAHSDGYRPASVFIGRMLVWPMGPMRA